MLLEKAVEVLADYGRLIKKAEDHSGGMAEKFILIKMAEAKAAVFTSIANLHPRLPAYGTIIKARVETDYVLPKNGRMITGVIYRLPKYEGDRFIVLNPVIDGVEAISEAVNFSLKAGTTVILSVMFLPKRDDLEEIVCDYTQREKN